MKVKHFQGLFVKAVVVLSIISLVPVVFIGYRVMQINSRLLKHELLQKQQTIASRLAATVRSAIAAKEQLLSEFGDLHTDFSSHHVITKSDLDYLQERNASLFYLRILSDSGEVLFDTGRQPQVQDVSLQDSILKTCLLGNRFISQVAYQDNRPYIWIAQPLHHLQQSGSVKGILVAAMYLDDIAKALLQSYPLDMDAVLVSGEGDLLSYNGAPEGMEQSRSVQLHQTLQDIDTQLDGAEDGEITLPDGEQVLVSSARVPAVDWTVYVFQPASVPGQLFVDNLFHSSLWDVIVVALVMLLFVGVVSYWVIIPITRPLARLRDAAVQLRESDDFVVKESDVEIPHNEIGELAGVFVEMSQTLHQRRQELMGTQQELAHMNQALEKRVEQRTRELKQATADLVKAERLVAIGQMASIISHEIRNPLAVISNASRLIKTLVRPTDQKVIKQFNIIESEIRQANSIISEVLGYARTRELILSMVDVNSYLHELVQSFPTPAGIVIKEDLAAESVRIKVDAEEIKQALRNLITNAVEAMPLGGTVTVGSRVGKRLVCLYVADTGPGVSEEVRQKMFSAFFTTKARGTGLGLAVVRKAISRHRGKLFIQSEQGRGTCFEIYLKIYRRMGDTNYGEAS
ncbi:MAG: HAMP domain-containing protein [Elusimicrobiaceae bacterium]|nr:HAMP domain-containing protein [Elusimicrobiaceae bacterium]